MLKKLLLVAVVASVASVSSATSANADWWWSNRASQPRCNQPDTLFFPQQNQMIIRQDLGYGTSIYSSSPIVQYGAPGTRFDRFGNADVYAPMQRYQPNFWRR